MSVEPSRPGAALRDATLAVYLLALVYGSLYPGTGWRSIGVAELGFLLDPWPRYWTWFDLGVNVAIYLPLGLLVGARRPRGGVRWVLTVVAGGSALSLSIEALQGFLPERVASRADWLANTTGVLIGTLFARRATRLAAWSDAHWARRSLTGSERAAGVGLLLLWVVLQLQPVRPLFGHGDLGGLILRVTGLDPRAGLDLALPIEAFATAAAVVAVGLMVREVWPARAPRLQITLALIGAALLIRSLGAGLQTGLSQALGWLSAGAQGGLVTGAAALSMLAAGRRQARMWAAVTALAATSVLTNVFPHDAYGASALLQSQRGSWRNFNGLLQALAMLWPFAALVWCALRVRALRPPPLASEERLR